MKEPRSPDTTTCKTISCDIDGILNTYPQCWLDYLAERCGIRYSSIKEAKDIQPFYKQYKIDYRNSTYKANLPVEQSGVDMVCRLKSMGYSIVMATSRPLTNEAYPELYNLTYNWLKTNNIPFDELVFKNSTADFVLTTPNLEFHIEDDMKYAIPIAERNVLVFLYSKHLKQGEQSNDPNIIVINNLDDIFKYVNHSNI